MKPLILEYAEEIEDLNSPSLLLEYSEALNLSVIKGTNTPVVEKGSLGTQTHTRNNGEGSDTDKNIVYPLMATETFTKASGEGSDSDR